MFSLIIPIYNRPEEIKELLESLLLSDYKKEYEIVIIEDGSKIDCKEVVSQYADKFSISYYFKENSGPGDSRNYGMKVAKGDYFIILDSDCLIPSNYLSEVEKELESELKIVIRKWMNYYIRMEIPIIIMPRLKFKN